MIHRRRRKRRKEPSKKSSKPELSCCWSIAVDLNPRSNQPKKAGSQQVARRLYHRGYGATRAENTLSQQPTDSRQPTKNNREARKSGFFRLSAATTSLRALTGPLQVQQPLPNLRRPISRLPQAKKAKVSHSKQVKSRKIHFTLGISKPFLASNHKTEMDPNG